MLLTITNTNRPATDLGYLLHKNPYRIHSEDTAAGTAYVFYPTATEACCTAALMLDADPIQLVRGKQGASQSEALAAQYVNDRPYVASSFLSVAMNRLYRSAMAGRCKERSELAKTALPLEASVPVVRCSGGEVRIQKLFAPLGYECEVTQRPFNEPILPPEASPYYAIRLRARITLQELLSHLYVLIPVLDDAKHYWVDEEEVKNLLRKGAGWLETHPEREYISHCFLRRQRSLTELAISRLLQEEEPDPIDAEEAIEQEEAAIEAARSLKQARQDQIIETLQTLGVKSVIDLGCGEGNLLRRLLEAGMAERVAGMDVSSRALAKARKHLALDRAPKPWAEKLELFQGSLLYRDKRLEGYDAAVLSEVIEHMDVPRLRTLEGVVFGCAQPAAVLVTTPNVEYNVHLERLAAGNLRHRDHRFEWTRAEFSEWAERVASTFGYIWQWQGIGESDPNTGPPTQMAVFEKLSAEDKGQRTL